ncbi:MAG: hypothetical protein AMJ81_10635 [Phycisphaerae bacterium SM23_33]|nr:MAG: hypothetical protein AMJ81_10635 [Phycisphaerae bacterium SM23_33]
MNRTATFLLWCFIVTVFSGCQVARLPAGPTEFAPILYGPARPGLGLAGTADLRRGPGAVELPPEKVDKSGPKISVTALFLSGPVDRLKELNLVPEKDIQTVSEADFKRRHERAKAVPELRALAAPRMMLWPGQRAWVAVQTQQAYVQDYRYLPNAGRRQGPCLEPIIGTIDRGTRLEVCVHLKGDKVVFTLIKPVISGDLGVRQCSAKVALDAKEYAVDWQEPVMFLATVGPGLPRDISLGPEQRLVLRLGYRVEQPAAAVRVLAAGGEVRERYRSRSESPRRPPLTRSAAAAHVQHLLVLSARKIESDQAKPPELPSIKATAQDEVK